MRIFSRAPSSRNNPLYVYYLVKLTVFQTLCHHLASNPKCNGLGLSEKVSPYKACPQNTGKRMGNPPKQKVKQNTQTQAHKHLFQRSANLFLKQAVQWFSRPGVNTMPERVRICQRRLKSANGEGRKEETPTTGPILAFSPVCSQTKGGAVKVLTGITKADKLSVIPERTSINY